MSLTTFAVIYADTVIAVAIALPLLIFGEAIRRTLCDLSKLDEFCQMWDSLEHVEFIPAPSNEVKVNPSPQPLQLICDACLDSLNIRELKALAKQARIKGHGSLNKQTLAKQLEAAYC